MAHLQLIKAPLDDKSFPEDRWYLPLDLLAVASAAERDGHKTTILDGGIWQLDKLSDVVGRDADVVGLTYSTMSIRSFEMLARLAHERGVRVIVGGQAATASAYSVAEEPFVDLVVAGDGEPAICNIARQVETGEWCPEKVPNAVFYYQGRHMHGPRVEISCDQIGRFSRLAGGVDPEDYLSAFAAGNTLKNIAAVRPTNLFSKRGCHAHCSFCARTDKRVRARAAREVAAEISELTTRFGLDYVVDHSDTWLSKLQWAREFVAERGRLGDAMPRMMIFADSRHLSAEAIELLPKAGVDNVLLGIESASERILLRNGKANSRRKIDEAILRLLDNGIRVSVSLVLGLLGEDDASLSETCRFAAHVAQLTGVRCYCNVIMPLPGSPAWDVFMSSAAGRKWSRALDFNLEAVRHDFIRNHTTVTGGVERLLKERNLILARNDLQQLEFAR